jgi:hypothetical protein
LCCQATNAATAMASKRIATTSNKERSTATARGVRASMLDPYIIGGTGQSVQHQVQPPRQRLPLQ